MVAAMVIVAAGVCALRRQQDVVATSVSKARLACESADKMFIL